MVKMNVNYGRKHADYIVYKYQGFTYDPWEDREEDNIKIWHDIKCPDGRTVHGDWSPYTVPSVNQFIDFIEVNVLQTEGYVRKDENIERNNGVFFTGKSIDIQC